MSANVVALVCRLVLVRVLVLIAGFVFLFRFCFVCLLGFLLVFLFRTNNNK